MEMIPSIDVKIFVASVMTLYDVNDVFWRLMTISIFEKFGKKNLTLVDDFMTVLKLPSILIPTFDVIYVINVKLTSMDGIISITIFTKSQNNLNNFFLYFVKNIIFLFVLFVYTIVDQIGLTPCILFKFSFYSLLFFFF